MGDNIAIMNLGNGEDKGYFLQEDEMLAERQSAYVTFIACSFPLPFSDGEG